MGLLDFLSLGKTFQLKRNPLKFSGMFPGNEKEVEPKKRVYHSKLANFKARKKLRKQQKLSRQINRRWATK